MTALSIAEAEWRAGENPQVSGLRRRGIRTEGDLASVTGLSVAPRRTYQADPEIFRHAGVSRPAGVSRRAAGRVRLTARGRAVLVGLAGALVACVCSLLAAGGAAAASHGSPTAGYQGMHQVVVEQGQTLWSIASAAEPTADPQAVIQEIMTTNSLPGSIVRAGQVLWVPKG